MNDTARAAGRAASAAVASPPEPSPQPAPPAVQAGRAAVLACLLGLIGLGLAWELVLAPTGSGTLALKVAPLALALPGVWRHRLYTYRWLSLLLWLYVLEGLVRATTESGLSQGLATAEVALSLGLFVACVLYIRRRLRSATRPMPTPATAHPT